MGDPVARPELVEGFCHAPIARPEYWYVPMPDRDRAYESNYGACFSQINEQFWFRIRRGAPTPRRGAPIPTSGGPPTSLAGSGADRGWGVPPNPHQRGLRPLWSLPPDGKPFAWLGLRYAAGPLLRQPFQPNPASSYLKGFRRTLSGHGLQHGPAMDGTVEFATVVRQNGSMNSP